jgi:hypothetical protein
MAFSLRPSSLAAITGQIVASSARVAFDTLSSPLRVGAHVIPRGWAQVIPQGVVL